SIFILERFGENVCCLIDPVLESCHKSGKALLSQKRCKFSPSQPVANNMFTFFISVWSYSVASTPF
ncbi:hypothetical protein, partial [Enterobacter hormaechei]|uniref:hypothetical protein n=1 Tax=Enterobacter hormaechei TaxID=158836 RepID=UPI0023E46144